MQHVIKATHKLKRADLVSLLCSAFESNGAGYWCEVTGSNKKGKTAIALVPLLKGGELYLKDIESDRGTRYVLDYKTMIRGLEVMASREPRTFADILTDDGDMTTGDVFVQCALFGKVKYS